MANDSERDPCVICTSHEAETFSSTSDSIHQLCPRCGEFKATGTALTKLRSSLGKEKRAKISGWISEQNRAGSIPDLTSHSLKEILSRPLPSVADRATNLLIEAERNLSSLSERFNINEPRFLSATYSSDKNDVLYLLQFLQEQGYAGPAAHGGSSEIYPLGHMRLDEIRKTPSTSAQGFIAMWFTDDLHEAYTSGFQKGIFDAGYNPLRIDQAEHVNKIDDEIIRQINASKFIVADFTGHRGGVYFEAGYAMGLDIPVFWTCKKDHMGDLHFDIRQFNCIDWESPDELAERLTRRVEAVVGPGPTKS